MESTIHIGADITKEGLAELKDVVLKVVGAPCGDTVKTAALVMLQNALQTNNATVTNCIFNSGEQEKRKVRK